MGPRAKLDVWYNKNLCNRQEWVPVSLMDKLLGQSRTDWSISAHTHARVAYPKGLFGLHFYVQWSAHRVICLNNYPTWCKLYSLFISANRSTCFGWYLHPSSRAHITVSTVLRPLLLPAVSVTLTAGSSNGLNNARYCRYSDMSSSGWMEIPSEIRRAVCRYK